MKELTPVPGGRRSRFGSMRGNLQRFVGVAVLATLTATIVGCGGAENSSARRPVTLDAVRACLSGLEKPALVVQPVGASIFGGDVPARARKALTAFGGIGDPEEDREHLVVVVLVFASDEETASRAAEAFRDALEDPPNVMFSEPVVRRNVAFFGLGELSRFEQEVVERCL